MADIICRWRNGTPKTVVELANSLPHEVMPIPQFRKAMSTKWNGDFFHTPYQLACQLALYCEAEDGMYYPRFDHDIDESEAHRYLELWINRYYIPNPYVASDGFQDLECPTYLMKSLYDYVQIHPGCDYATAYHACFHDVAKNNDDIVRNYINRFSKVLSFSKNGTLTTTDINAKQIFSFMDRNNKKEFFDTFSLENEKCLMDSYLDKDIDQKEQMFYDYLKSTGLAESSCKQYAFTHPFHEEVIKIIQNVAHKDSLFDVINVWQVKNIHKQVCALEGNKKQGSAWSATISNYINFLNYLDVGTGIEDGLDCKERKLLKESTNLVEFFAFAVKTIVSYDSSLELAQDSLSFNKVSIGFKNCPFGRKTDSLYTITTPGHQDDYDLSTHWKVKGIEYCFYKEQTLDKLRIFANKINQIYGNKFLIEISDASYRMYELEGKNNALIKDVKDSSREAERSLTSSLSFGSFRPRQIIYYGAPGTGKSHTIKKEEDEGKIVCIRTTFHPDSDYATFVGCYKPHKCKETGNLTYEFVEQAFLSAYRMAWMNPDKEIALVIEEINRGNCAQVFGDIFQLLDRDENGWSTYPIKADTDICDYLEEQAIPCYSETMVKKYGKGKAGYGYLALPPNMSILATMNTSDQSLFPIDSAFKRRWDWRYIPICQGRTEPKEGEQKGELLDWKIETSAEKRNWWDFLRAINGIIESTTHSEDKELGFFFCKADENGVISADKFVNKVVFYLWTDVFKTYGFRSDIFNKDEEGKTKLSFKDFFCQETGKPNMDTVKLFVENVMKHLPKDVNEIS